MSTTIGMLQCSKQARTSPMESASSLSEFSTNRSHPGREGCAGAACTDRPSNSRCSISAKAVHRREMPSTDNSRFARVFFRRCRQARKRRLWSRRWTPFLCRVNATALASLPAMAHIFMSLTRSPIPLSIEPWPSITYCACLPAPTLAPISLIDDITSTAFDPVGFPVSWST